MSRTTSAPLDRQCFTAEVADALRAATADRADVVVIADPEQEQIVLHLGDPADDTRAELTTANVYAVYQQRHCTRAQARERLVTAALTGLARFDERRQGPPAWATIAPRLRVQLAPTQGRLTADHQERGPLHRGIPWLPATYQQFVMLDSPTVVATVTPADPGQWGQDLDTVWGLAIAQTRDDLRAARPVVDELVLEGVHLRLWSDGGAYASTRACFPDLLGFPPPVAGQMVIFAAPTRDVCLALQVASEALTAGAALAAQIIRHTLDLQAGPYPGLGTTVLSWRGGDHVVNLFDPQ